MDKSSGSRRTQEGGRDSGSRAQGKESSTTEVFVGNLSWSATEDDLRQHFASCGRITRVKLLMGEDGRSKGSGFVGFESAEAMEAALQLNGSEFMGRTMKVSRSGERAPRREGGAAPRQAAAPTGDTTVVFVGNVSYTCTEEDLHNFFAPCGEISTVRLAKDPDGRPKGFAHIEFTDKSSIAQAVALSNSELNGRQIRVEPSVPRESAPRGRGRGGKFGAKPAEAPAKAGPGGWD